MKSPLLIVLVSFFLFLFPRGLVLGEGQIKYSIQIQNDGSAIWIVSQIVEANASLETMQSFQDRVTSLVTIGRNTTRRDMTVGGESLQFAQSGSYIDVERTFTWTNFSKVESTRLIIDDVFEVQGFFVRLYGDGEVYMTYPLQYSVETVFPKPSERDDFHQSLHWLGTSDFEGSTHIVFVEKSVNGGFVDTLAQNAALIAGLAAIAVAFSTGFYMFSHVGKKKVKAPRPGLPEGPLGMENDEEKTLKLIKSSGGSLYQSSITDQFGFSKAKTSQLLRILEEKGLIRRYKKGREKIVVLLEPGIGES